MNEKIKKDWRKIGIKVIAIIWILGGAWGFLYNLFFVPPFIYLFLFPLLILCIFHIFGGTRLLSLKNWGRKAIIILSWISIGIFIGICFIYLPIIFPETTFIERLKLAGENIGILIFYGFCIWFLTRSSIKKYFVNNQ